MKKIILPIIFAFLTIYIQAQDKPIIFFAKTVHDYGVIKQEINEVKAIFSFKNTGNKPLLIQTVYPSCGCTSANYTKTPVLPGKKGSIEAVFHTKDIYGSFQKSILVYTNDTANKILSLYLKGKIIQKGKPSEDAYSQAIGNIFFKSNHLAFNSIKNTEIKTDTLWFYNAGNKKIKIEFINQYNWLSLSKYQFKLKPDKKSYTLISYDAGKRNDWGLNFDKIVMKTNDDTLAEKNIFVSAEIKEDYSQLTSQQLADAPRIIFDSINYEFGEIKEGEHILHDFFFTNTGKTDLVIHKLTSACGCIHTTIENKTIKPGQRSKIGSEFYTEGKPGEHQKTITVITNDPINSTIILSLIGIVK